MIQLPVMVANVLGILQFACVQCSLAYIVHYELANTAH